MPHPVLYVQVTVHRDKLRINNQIDASNTQNLFCHETLHVSGIFCAHHQELYQLYTWQLLCFMQPDSPRQRPHNLRETYQLPTIQLITPDDEQRRCLKHAEFRDKINFGYLNHLVGYLYEAYVLMFIYNINVVFD